MNAFEFYSNNLIYQAKKTASSENAQFPLNNITDPRTSKVFRTNSSSDNIVFDFQETSEIDSFFIVGDKRNGLGIHAITLEFNHLNEWAAPAESVAVTIDAEYNSGFTEFPVKEYRFCRMVMTSTLPYCEIANIFLGNRLNLGRSINFNWSLKDNELSTKQVNRYGQIFSDIIGKQRTISAALSLLDKDQLDKINYMIDFYGESRPFFVRIGCDNMVNNNLRFSGMFYFNDSPQISNPYFGRYNLSFTLNEAT
jgi:hypothetical protein